MLFGAVIAPGGSVTPKDEFAKLVHISQVCLNDPKNNEKTYVQLVDGKSTYNVCVLQKDVCEHVSLDIFFSTEGGIKLATKGGKNEVHVVGYFEPEEESYLSDSDDEDLEEDGAESDESDEEPASKKKNTGKEKK